MNVFLAKKCSKSRLHLYFYLKKPKIRSYEALLTTINKAWWNPPKGGMLSHISPPGHVSLGPLSSISQSQEASRGQAPHFSKHSKRNSVTHDSEFSEVKTNFCCCCHELNFCLTEFFSSPVSKPLDPKPPRPRQGDWGMGLTLKSWIIFFKKPSPDHHQYIHLKSHLSGYICR